MTHIKRNNGSERERTIHISIKHKMAVPEEEDAEVHREEDSKRCPNVIAMMTKGIERAFYRVVQRN